MPACICCDTRGGNVSGREEGGKTGWFDGGIWMCIGIGMGVMSK